MAPCCLSEFDTDRYEKINVLSFKGFRICTVYFRKICDISKVRAKFTSKNVSS